MRFLRWFALLLMIALVGALLYVQPLLRVGAGYAAKMACTCHFVQERTLADIQATDLNYSALPYVTLTADEANKMVRASFYGMAAKTAHFISGRGCVLRADDKAELPNSVSNAYEASTTELPTYDTLPNDINIAALKQVVEEAFVPMPQGGTRAVVVLHDGRLVHEAYAPGFDQNSRLLGWSMTKSITNALVGMMVKQGAMQLDQQQLFAHWQDERAEIALADLLHMNSGLQWNEAYGGTSDATVMLYEQADMAAYTASKPLEFTPDSVYEYSSGTTNLLTQLIRNTLNDDEQYYSLFQDSLFGKLGIYDPYLECDQSGNLVGSSYAWLRARDWAKLGQLYLQDGVWNGNRILPEGWVNWSKEAANGSEGDYAAQIWRSTSQGEGFPSDMFLFRGYQDQRVIIVPSKKCVIVRLGVNEDQAFPFDGLINGVLEALP